MNIMRSLLFRAIVMVTLFSPCIYLICGKDSPIVYIVRNVAWNDFTAQIASAPDESPQDSLRKELQTIQKFLKSHETEVRVGIYDVEVFKAIDQVRARLQKADRDLETVRSELSYKESKQSSGGDPWIPGQSSSAPNVSSQLSRERAGVSSASRFRGGKAITSSTTGFARGTAGKAT